ncbi:hypothetical protein BH23GEM9_BH23GEM9_32450 [soil metagenome]
MPDIVTDGCAAGNEYCALNKVSVGVTTSQGEVESEEGSMHGREGYSGGQDPVAQGQMEPGTPEPGSERPGRQEPGGGRSDRTAQGGSYGGGGGYRQGGYERGNFDPALETPSPRASRDEGSRGGWGQPGAGGARSSQPGAGGARSSQPGAGGARHGRGRDYGDYADPRADYGLQESAGGDWRTGYGGYGMSGQQRQNVDDERQDWIGYDKPAGEYGLGGRDWPGGRSGPTGPGGSGTDPGESVPVQPWRERGPSGRGPDRQLPMRPHNEGRWSSEGGSNRGGLGQSSWRGGQRRDAGMPGSRDQSPGGGGRGELHWPCLEPWAVPGPHTGRGPEDYERSEEAIRTDVCERLTLHGRLDASRIRVLVERGEIMLEGEVDSRSAKKMAEDTAESVAGVQDVHNRLRISHRAR